MLVNIGIYTMLSNAVSSVDFKTFFYSRNITIGLMYAIISLISCLNIKDLGICGGLIHFDYTIQIFSIFLFIVTILILNLTNSYPFIIKKDKVESNKLMNLKDKEEIYIYNKLNLLNNKFNQFNITEYSIIILLIITGSTFLMSSLDLVTIFLAIELQSYGLYILCTLHRNSESSTSAGLTYFLLGSLASCFILLGQGLIYANEGNTSLENLQIITAISDASLYSNINYIYNSIQIALIILSVGFLFKISAAPFHFWSPDVYDSIPTIITTFVTIVTKISILIFILKIINMTFKDLYSFSWINCLLISSVISMIIGTILGLTQYRIKRLYAYSTISHIGFILLSLSIFSIESIQAFFFYLVQYSLSNLNLFFITIVIGYTLFLYSNKEIKNSINNINLNKLERFNSPLQLISQLKGYFFANPILSLSLAITLFSFAGIPPLTGFFAKQMVLKVAISKGYIFISLIAILTSVISAVYYLMIIKQMFFDNSSYKYPYKFNNINITISEYLVDIISILTLSILTFIFYINEVLNFFNILSFMFFNLI